MNKLKQILSNKNIVTALSFILIGIVIIFGYNYRIKEATKPITIPYAKVTIGPQTKITDDMISTMEVAADVVKKGYFYTKLTNIVGKYTNLETTVYKGSFFYKGAILEKDALPSSALLDIPDAETLLSLNIDMNTSYFNSLVPGDYFDLYVKTIGVLTEDDKNNEIIVGKLLNKIKILAVKTESGENVFGTDEARTPSGILFSVPEDYALLIMKAKYFAKLDNVAEIEFAIIPRGQKYEPKDNETVTATLTSEQLQNYINEKTKDVDINEIKNNNETENNNKIEDTKQGE